VPPRLRLAATHAAAECEYMLSVAVAGGVAVSKRASKGERCRDHESEVERKRKRKRASGERTRERERERERARKNERVSCCWLSSTLTTTSYRARRRVGWCYVSAARRARPTSSWRLAAAAVAAAAAAALDEGCTVIFLAAFSFIWRKPYRDRT
jgi:hypothetical protein